MRRWQSWLGLVFVLGGLGYFGRELVTHLDRIPPLEGGIGTWLAVGISLLGVVLTILIIGLFWRALLADQGVPVRRYTAIRIVAVSQIGKYLPGNLGHYVGRAGMARANGIPLGVATSTTLLEILWTAALGAGLTAMAIGLLSAGSGSALASLVGPWQLLLGCLVLVIAPWPAILILNRVLPGLSQRLNNGKLMTVPSFRVAMQVGIGLLLCFVMLGVSVTAQVRGLFGVDEGHVGMFVLLFAAAWTAGYLVPGAPGGVGVREGLIVGLFAPVIGGGAAVGLAVSSRVLTIAGDGLGFLLGLVMQYREGQRP